MNSTTAASSQVLAALIAGRTGSEQHHRGTHSLASATDDVFGHLADEDHVGVETIPDDGIERRHVFGDRRVKLRERQGTAQTRKNAMVGADCDPVKPPGSMQFSEI
jgi:hypothetical protein